MGRLRASPTERICYHVALAFEVDGIPEGIKIVKHVFKNRVKVIKLGA